MGHIVKYHNARLIDRDGDRRGCLLLQDGYILYAGPEAQAPDCIVSQTVDVKGMALMPAFVDLHCHLRDPGYPQKETLKTGMQAALAGGYATLCAMANTLPVTETPAQVEENLRRAQELSLCRLYQAAAAGKGLGDSIPTDWAALSNVTPVLTNDGNTIRSDAFMEQLLQASRELGFLISTHCQPERATVARDLALLPHTGGHLHIGHISHAETVDMVREAKAKGLRVTCEITPHHLIGYDMNYRVNPPLRTPADAQALVQAIMDGTADCLATDHAPHTPEDKQNGMAGISNIDYAMGVYLWVFAQHNIPLTRFSQMISYTPAKLLGLKAGLLQPGYLADLVIVDVDWEGRVRLDAMHSRSHNTPFAGRPLKGQVMTTIVEGEVRYDHGSFIR